MKQNNKIVGGVLLVVGTTIGAGMLALPVSTGSSGFIPSSLLFLFYWVFMTYTAFLMLEVTLWVGEGNNLVTMAKVTLGRWGQVASWIVYLFLLYSLNTAYIAGSAPIVLGVIQTFFKTTLPEWVGFIPLMVIFGFCVYKGTKLVDQVNRVLMFGLVIAYAVMVVFLTPHVDSKLLMHVDWRYVLLGVSVVATSFGFHIIIPSLVSYLDRDLVKLKKVLWIGSIIPLVIYLSWELLALGIIPVEGEHGIIQGHANGSNGAYLLSTLLGQSSLALLATFFAFFAIVTSFLGVSLSLFDFLADGLKIEKNRSGRILLYCMTFLPPLVITLIDPQVFLTALEYAGAFGVITLLGLFPALMVWSGRYFGNRGGSSSTFRVPGGKIALVIVILISVAVIGMEIALKTNLLVIG